MAKSLNMVEGIMEIDNSNLLARKRTRWEPLPTNWVKLNFNGVVRMEGSSVGGIVRDSKGTMLLAYSG